MASRYIEIHPENPQPRLIQQVVDGLHDGAVIAYPTDSSYALGCHTGDKAALDRIRAIRHFDNRHQFTLMCSDLSQAAVYAKMDNTVFRLIKSITPGPYTLILPATHEVPRRLQNRRRKTIGIRLSGHPICHALLETLGEPLMSCTLMFEDSEIPLNNPEVIREHEDHRIDYIVDSGICEIEPTTVVDLTQGAPVLIRQGLGDVVPLGL